MTARVPEAALQSRVMDLCRLYGLRVHHCRAARTAKGWATPIQGDAGFVDLVICGPRGVLFRELKSAVGRVSDDQRAWLDTLTEAGADADVWRPADFGETGGRILTELAVLRDQVSA